MVFICVSSSCLLLCLVSLCFLGFSCVAHLCSFLSSVFVSEFCICSSVLCSILVLFSVLLLILGFWGSICFCLDFPPALCYFVFYYRFHKSIKLLFVHLHVCFWVLLSHCDINLWLFWSYSFGLSSVFGSRSHKPWQNILYSIFVSNLTNPA